MSQRLTAAVSNAGGLGSFGANALMPAEIEYVIAEIRAMTSLPPGQARSDPEPLRFEPHPFGPFVERMPLTTRGDVFVVPTPGHTPGHVSVVVEGTPTIFIAGDTSYTEELLRGEVVDGVSPDVDVARKTIQRILALDAERPLVYLPSHDPDSADRLMRLETLTRRAA